MNQAKHITNLVSLEREIYRLQLESRKLEDKLEKNFEFLQENLSTLVFNSFFKRRKEKAYGKDDFSSFWQNGRFGFVVEKISDHIATRVSEAVGDLVDRVFHKHK